MTLQDAKHYLQKTKPGSPKKTVKKRYEKLLNILKGLEEKQFLPEELQKIESELDKLDIDKSGSEADRQLKSFLPEFEKFLAKNFLLVTKDYFTTLGIIFGSTFGLMVGIVILSTFERSMGISIGLSIGTLVGVLIGEFLDRKARKEGRVL